MSDFQDGQVGVEESSGVGSTAVDGVALEESSPAPGSQGESPKVNRQNALRERPFRLLWGNVVTFALVQNAQRFAYIWLVVDVLGRDEGSAGLVGFTIGLPVLLLVLQAGALADRVDRRTLLVVSQLGGLAVVAVTGVLLAAGTIGMTSTIVLTLTAGGFNALGQPVRLALVPVLVRREQLLNAIALNALTMTGSMILGPVLAQMIGGLFGIEAAFFFMAGLLLVGLVFLVRLPLPPSQAGSSTAPRTSMRSGVGEAARHVWADRGLRPLFGLLIVGNLCLGSVAMTLLPSLVKESFGRDGGDAGALMAMMGIGMSISSVYIMRRGDLPRKGARFMQAMMGGTTIIALVGLSPGYYQAMALLLVMGMCGGFYINMNQSLIQAHTPAALMGRVMSLYTLAQQGFMPIGALAAGLIAQATDIRWTFAGAGAIGLVTVVSTFLTQPILREMR
ncbi:MAG: MFS transporter [Acidimicrobiales bacterium]